MAKSLKETQKQIEMQNSIDEANDELLEIENTMSNSLSKMIDLAMEADDNNSTDLYESLLAKIDFQDQQIKAFRGMRIEMSLASQTASATLAMAKGISILEKFTGKSLNLPSDKKISKYIASINNSMSNILSSQKRMIRGGNKISVATQNSRTEADMERAKRMVEDRRIKRQLGNSNFAEITSQIEKAKNSPVSN